MEDIVRKKVMERLCSAAKKLEKQNKKYLRTPEGKVLLSEALEAKLAWPEMERVFQRHQNTIEKVLSYHGLYRGHLSNYRHSDEVLMIIKNYYEKSANVKSKAESALLSDEMMKAVNKQKTKEGLRPLTMNAIRCVAKSQSWKWGWKIGSRSEPAEPSKMEEREWPQMVELPIDKRKWKEVPDRVGFFSGIDYKDAGYRAGLIIDAFEIFAYEACRYICFVGRLVNKYWFKNQLKGISAKYKKEMEEQLVREAAKELAYAWPRIKKPEGKNEYVRIYIVTSPPYDNEIGERVARKLQELRPDDIRVYRPGDKVEVKGIDKIIGLICPENSRLPSEYFSAMVDREVKDKEGQTSVDYPDLWVVGTPSSSVHEPRRGRKPPVISLPSCKRLQRVRIGENQQGIRIVEWSKDGKDYCVRTYSFKDLTKNERQFITGIKDGAKKIHYQIVEIIKNEGARPEGVIADALGMDNERAKVNEALQFLVEEKMSPRKNWPGLYYDAHSQNYDFHLDWIQEKLRYPSLISTPLTEERFVFFSCLHTGYNTTDYDYVVREFPKKNWQHRVMYICCLGDGIAGLSHNFLEQGEVMGSMNYTDQEIFYAELIGTGLIKVFEWGLEELTDVKKMSPLAIIDKLLPFFIYIAGNHDDWQKRLGLSPLTTFRYKLILLLMERLESLLKKYGFSIPFSEFLTIINSKLIELSIDSTNYNPVFKLPSGLSLELHHPHMGRAKTKSMRAQEMLDSSDAQIMGQGNFHTAIVTEKWEPDLGQRVNVEAGTFVIFTTFERQKGNKKVAFGPVYLRVGSRNQRIIMTESSYDNTPILQKPRPKWTDWQKLKDELGVYRSP